MDFYSLMLASLTHLKDRLTGRVPKGYKRSPYWRHVRKTHLKKPGNEFYVVCGSAVKLEVHHIIPFHVAPELELDPRNLATVCRRKKYGIHCHLLIGHLGNYKRYNEYFRKDAEIWSDKLGYFHLNNGATLR